LVKDPQGFTQRSAGSIHQGLYVAKPLPALRDLGTLANLAAAPCLSPKKKETPCFFEVQIKRQTFNPFFLLLHENSLSNFNHLSFIHFFVGSGCRSTHKD